MKTQKSMVVCRLWAVFLLAGWVAALAGCAGTANLSPTPTLEEPTLVLNEDAQTAAAKTQGFDVNRLNQAARSLPDRQLDAHSLLVYRNGVLVSESYFGNNRYDHTHDLYSVTKSFVSTLVGIAIDEGKIESLQTPALDYFPEMEVKDPSGEKAAITLEHLLTMTTGLGWEESDSSYRALYASRDWVQWMFDLPMSSQPGSEFNYCSGCSHVLAAIIERATGENLQKFAADHLFQPLDISDYAWQTDSKNTPIGGWGLQLRPRDMAKLGKLYLDGGRYNGHQVVSEDWVKEATRVHVQVDETASYGYLWWINGDNPKIYSARGRYGQFVYVNPELKVVVVTTAAVDDMNKLYDFIQTDILSTIIQ